MVFHKYPYGGINCDLFSVVYFAVVMMQGPLSVFCARARWGPVHVICLQWGEEGLGLTLRGDSPVLVAGVVPGGCAAVRHPLHYRVDVDLHDGCKQRLLDN